MKWPASLIRIVRSHSDPMRLLPLFLFAAPLFAQPEIFILPPSSSLITPATQEPFTALTAINTRNVPAFFFQNAEGTKYYSVGRTPTDTVVVLDVANPGVVLARLNLSATTVAVLSPDRRRLLVGGSAGLHIIDTATDTVVATIPGPAPTDLGVSLDGHRAYVLTDQLTTINLLTNAVVSVLPIARFATGLAVNYTGIVYVSAQDRLYEIVDVGTPRIHREFDVPGRPGRLIFTPDGRTGLAVNQTPATGFSILRFDLVLGGLSGGIQDTGLKLDSLFLTEPNRAIVYSAQSRVAYKLILDPFLLNPVNPEGYFFPADQGVGVSSEFPRGRTVYFSALSETVQDPPNRSIVGGGAIPKLLVAGRVVSAPPSFTGTPAYLYLFNGEGNSGSLPLIVRVTDSLGRSLRDVRVLASNGETAVSNADGWAFFRPPGSLGTPVTVTAGAAKAIFRLGAPSRAPASISILAGQGQMLSLPPSYPSPFRLVVRDAAGFPVADTLVQFSISGGVGQLACRTSPVCAFRTDANGQVELGFVPGRVPPEDYYQQQQVTVTADGAPRRTIFITTRSFGSPARAGMVAPVGTSISGIVNTVLPNAIQVSTFIVAVEKVGQPIPNIGFSIATSLAFPDLGCDGEAGVVLTNAAGVASCSLQLGSRTGVIELISKLRMDGVFMENSRSLRLEIFAADVPVLRFVGGQGQTLSGGATSLPIVVRATDRLGLPVAGQLLQWSVDPPSGLLLHSAAATTDASGQAVAIAIAASVPGKYSVRAIGNGLSAETSLFIRGTSRLSSPRFTLSAIPAVFGIGITPTPFESSWTVEGLPPWIRTSTPAGSGQATIWFVYDLNESTTTARTATITIGGAPIEIVQNAGVIPRLFLRSVASTSGSTGTFRVEFWGPEARLHNVTNLLIRDSLDGRSACYAAYSAPQRKLYLVSDGGPEALLPPIAIPSQESVSNSQCTVLGIESYPPNSFGPPYTFQLKVAFPASFAGAKVVYGALSDIYGRSSGWNIVGTHQVPGAAVTYPRPLTPSPATVISNGVTIPISFTFEDQTDAKNIETAWMLTGDALDGRNACSIAYHRPSNQVFLIPDSGLGQAANSMPLTGSGVLLNSQCEINASGAVVTQTGPQLTVTLPIRFTNEWIQSKPKAVWTAVQTLSGQRSIWQALGVVRPPF